MRERWRRNVLIGSLGTSTLDAGVTVTLDGESI